MAETKELRALFSAQSKQLEESFRRISRETKGLQKSSAGLTSGIKKLAIGLGALLIARKVGQVFKSAVVKFAEFEKGLAEVATLSDFSTKQIQKMGKETLKMSRQFGQGIKVLTKARYDIVSAGFSDIREQTILLTTANKLAVAGVTDVSTATDLLTSVLNAYQLSAEDAEAVSDDLFTTVRLGKTTIPELADALGKVLPTAASLGVSLKDLGAALAASTAAGINTSESVTALNALLFGLAAPAGAAGKAFKTMGIETTNADGSLKSLNSILGQFKGKTLEQIKEFIPEREAAKEFLALANNIEKLDKNTKEFADTTGAIDIAFGKMSKTLDFQLKRLGKTWDVFLIKIFSTSDAGNDLREAISELNKFFDANEEKIDDVAAAIGNLAAGAITEGLIPAFELAGKTILAWDGLLKDSGDGISVLRKELNLLAEDIIGVKPDKGIFLDTLEFWAEVSVGAIDLNKELSMFLDDEGQKRLETTARQAAEQGEILTSSNKKVQQDLDVINKQIASERKQAFEKTTVDIVDGFQGAIDGMKTLGDTFLPLIPKSLGSAFSTIVGDMSTRLSNFISEAGKKTFTIRGILLASIRAIFGGGQEKARGGEIKPTSFQFGGAVGTDTELILATPGEIIINKKTSQANKKFLLGLNAGKFAKGGMVKGFQRGGEISGQGAERFVPTMPGGAGTIEEQFAEFQESVIDFSTRIQELVISKMIETEQLAFERAQALMEIQAMPFSEDQAAVMEGLVNEFYDLQAQAIEDSKVEEAAKQRMEKVLKWSNFMASGLERASQQILSGEKKFGVAFALLGIEFLKELIRVMTAAIIAKKIAMIGLAVIESPETFGASLAKIAPITAAAAVALGALSALGGAVGGGGAPSGGAPGAAGLGVGAVTPGFAPEGAEAPGAGIIINVTVEGNVVDSQAFVEDTIAPVLADAIGRGTLAGSEFNLVVEKD